MGSALSVISSCSFGSSLSLRSFARLGASVSIVGKLYLSDSMHFLSANKGFYSIETGVGVTKRLTFPDPGVGEYSGILHGTWLADNAIATSDRRLKSNIMPLYQTLIKRHNASAAEQGEKPHQEGSSGIEEQASRAIGWMLRELRPVSFAFKEGGDAKVMGERKEPQNQRFGFVAQEVERVLPDVVREVGETKHLIYQDLIAMITLAAQDHQKRINKNDNQVSKLRSMVKQLAGTLGQLSKKVAKIVSEPYVQKSSS